MSTPSGHAMLAQQRVAGLADVLVYTGGERPIDGDRTRITYTRWPDFELPSVWRRPGVHSHRNAPMIAAVKRQA